MSNCTCEYPYEVEGVGHHPFCGMEPDDAVMPEGGDEQ